MAVPDDDRDIITAVAHRFWWVPVVAGVLSAIAGFIVLAAPRSSLLTIAVILGAYLAAIGLMQIVAALMIDGQRPSRIAQGLVGTLAVVAGVIVIARPDGVVKGVAIAFGIWLLIAAGFGFANLFVAKERTWWDALRCLIDLAAGIIIVVQPGIALATLAVILGIYLLVHGAAEVAAGILLRRIGHQPAAT
jgi:uncharacterized membrane protein HdeD (DUF308 family)